MVTTEPPYLTINSLLDVDAKIDFHYYFWVGSYSVW